MYGLGDISLVLLARGQLLKQIITSVPQVQESICYKIIETGDSCSQVGNVPLNIVRMKECR